MCKYELEERVWKWVNIGNGEIIVNYLKEILIRKGNYELMGVKYMIMRMVIKNGKGDKIVW